MDCLMTIDFYYYLPICCYYDAHMHMESLLCECQCQCERVWSSQALQRALP